MIRLGLFIYFSFAFVLIASAQSSRRQPHDDISPHVVLREDATTQGRVLHLSDSNHEKHAKTAFNDAAWNPNSRKVRQDSLRQETDNGEPGREYQRPSTIPPAIETGIEWPESTIVDEVTIDDLIQFALQNNPTLRQAQAHITAETGKAIQAGLYPNPVFRYSAEQIGVGGTPGEFQGGIVSQEIVRGNKLMLSRQKYLQRIRVAEAQAIAQQFRVCNDVRILFFEALALQEQYTIQTELVKTAEDSAVTIREAFQMGQANAVDIRRSNVELQKVRLAQLEISNSLQETKHRLGSLIGVEIRSASVVGQLEGRIESIDFDSIYVELLETSPELLAARSKLQSDRIAIQRELAEPVPNLQIEGGAGRNFDAGETVAVAGIGVRLPLFDRNQGTIHQARADYHRQCSEIERLELELKQRLASQFQEYTTATQHIDQFQQWILPDLREVYRLMLQSYKDNRISWQDVLQAQSDYFQARRDYQHWLARWRHSQVLINGLLLEGGLMAAEGATPPGHIDATPKPR